MLGGWRLGSLIVAVGLMGCTGSVVVKQHSLYPSAGDSHYARVYLLRPQAQRTRGVADNAVGIELGHEKLAEVAEGEYVLVYLKPGETDLVTRSQTYMTAKAMPVEVWRARHFNFEADHDYFILIQQDYEEFRGIYYLPKEIDAAQAQTLVQRLHAADALAKQHPLAALP